MYARLAGSLAQAEGCPAQLAIEATVAELLGFLPAQQRAAVELRFGLGPGGRGELSVRQVARTLQVRSPLAICFCTLMYRLLRRPRMGRARAAPAAHG